MSDELQTGLRGPITRIKVLLYHLLQALPESEWNSSDTQVVSGLLSDQAVNELVNREPADLKRQA